MSMESKPPRSPHSNNSLSTGGNRRMPTTSTSSSWKALKKSSSDSPSASATNGHGREELDRRLRSVLSHPLGIPLLYAFYQQEPPQDLKVNFYRPLPELSPNSNNILVEPNEEKDLLGLFAKAVESWVSSGQDETALTKTIATEANSVLGMEKYFLYPLVELKVEDCVNGKRHGRIDIAFSEADNKNASVATSPCLVIEVGLNGDNWFKKLDQGMLYLERMLQDKDTKCAQFQEPLLLAIITLNMKKCGKEIENFQMGVFLCLPHPKKRDFRMILLWQSEINDLKEASQFFGRMLLIATWFLKWWMNRNGQGNLEKKEEENSRSDDNEGYEYFSSNCCKMSNKVVRIFDNRFRKTQRSPIVYLKCKDIVGKSTKIDFKISGESIYGFNGGPLVLIATDYRKGRHYAEKLSEFAPIVEQLHKLHEKGFVHGDIRGFNTVFGDEGSWLIDFDFGGECGVAQYPAGYKQELSDGHRLRGEGKIQKFHDWYALGTLIFEVHKVGIKRDSDQRPLLLSKLDDIKSLWEDPAPDIVSENKLNELIHFLQNGSDEYTVKAGQRFCDFLEQAGQKGKGDTKIGATGSPPQKK